MARRLGWLGLGSLVAGAAAEAAELRIASPAAGVTVTSGQRVTVEVEGSPDVARILLVVNQPGGPGLITELPGPRALFDLTLPVAAVGSQNLVASGFDDAGRLAVVSATVHVDAVPPAQLTSLTVYPPTVYVRVGTPQSLEVTGHYADGVDRNLNGQPNLVLTFDRGTASQSAPGTVVLNGTDDSVVVSIDGVRSPPVPIRALPGRPAPP